MILLGAPSLELNGFFTSESCLKNRIRNILVKLERIHTSSILAHDDFNQATYSEGVIANEINSFRFSYISFRCFGKLRTCSGPDGAIYHTPTPVNFTT